MPNLQAADADQAERRKSHPPFIIIHFNLGIMDTDMDSTFSENRRLEVRPLRIACEEEFF